MPSVSVLPAQHLPAPFAPARFAEGMSFSLLPSQHLCPNPSQRRLHPHHLPHRVVQDLEFQAVGAGEEAAAHPERKQNWPVMDQAIVLLPSALNIREVFTAGTTAAHAITTLLPVIL